MTKRPYAAVTTDKLHLIANSTRDEQVCEAVKAEIAYRAGTRKPTSPSHTPETCTTCTSVERMILTRSGDPGEEQPA